MGKPDSSPDHRAWQSRPGFQPEQFDRAENVSPWSLGKTDPEKPPRTGDLFDINPDAFGSLEVRPEDILGLT